MVVWPASFSFKNRKKIKGMIYHVNNILVFCQGSSVNMQINQRLYEDSFSNIANHANRLGVVFFVGKDTKCWN